MKLESVYSWKTKRWGEGKDGEGRRTGRGLALGTETSSREWELLYNGQVVCKLPPPFAYTTSTRPLTNTPILQNLSQKQLGTT